MTDAPARTTGILYIVATPIGHRDDISLRALKTLESVDLILAEDTRHSMPLLNALGIKKPMVSLHAHNESSKSDEIISKLLKGQSCALISDAGTPLISDPGFPLVRLARSQGISVIPIPGACALITALSAAGVSCDTFSFHGFLPAKSSARRQKLESLKQVEHTLVFYESTHRLIDCIDDIAQVFGEHVELVVAKELTKTFERFIAGTCLDVKEWLLLEQHIKGEFVVIIPPRLIHKEPHDHQRLLSILLSELPLKQAVKLACQITGEQKNVLYKIALELQTQ
jgi:16S rRNA (cytidine1402-2'-O)-methyltransferase